VHKVSLCLLHSVGHTPFQKLRQSYLFVYLYVNTRFFSIYFILSLLNTILLCISVFSKDAANYQDCTELESIDSKYSVEENDFTNE
jgi:hypothetical protein